MVKVSGKSAFKPKGNAKRAAPTRYFDTAAQQDDSELKPVKLKRKSQQNFKGEVIKVEDNVAKPFRRGKPQNGKFKNRKTVEKPKIPQELLKKYSHGPKVEGGGVKTKFFKDKQQRKEIYLEYATEQAARTELLLQESSGFIEPDTEEITAEYRQSDIVQNVDLQSAAKHFKLKLDFGPYTMRYTKNGRHLLLGGRRGHVAAFDWVTKKLHCEINVMEEVADVQWLHVPTMFAVAQKEWVYIYDSKGTELHCIKRLHRVNRMDFLPYHFLLATGNSSGYASWLDVSIGEMIGNFNTQLGEIRMMRHNPSNGVLCIGSGKGVVSLWSPKVREPLAKLLCHPTAMSALTVDPKGLHLVTAGLDRHVKVWDVRQLSGPLANYSLRLAVNQVEVSQRGVLAVAQGNYCELYTSLLLGREAKTPYLRQSCDGFIHGMRFCNYEDVLGISTASGFQSLLVPGSGEANFDAYEDNPYQTRKQRREQEVHALLEKIPPELISLDPNDISGVDVPTLQEKIDAKRSIFYIKPPQIEMNSRRKMKGKGGSANAARNKQIVKDAARKKFITEVREAKKQVIASHQEESENYIPLNTESRKLPWIFDRFMPKTKKKQN